MARTRYIIEVDYGGDCSHLASIYLIDGRGLLESNYDRCLRKKSKSQMNQ